MNPVNRLLNPVFLFTLTLLFFTIPEARSNDPCNAFCYDFSCNANNCSVSQSCAPGTDWVPCGMAANTSPSVDIDAAGTTSFALEFPGGSCGSGLLPPPNDYVAWFTFVIQGSSFEWQIVEGPDDVYYEFYYSNLEEDDPDACTDITYHSCGDDFSSWELIGSPRPDRPTRMYVAIYTKNPDSDVSVVLKFRKACGEACTNSDIAVSASGATCIMGGSTPLSASASGGGGGPYTYLWSPNDGTIDDINSATPNVSPTQTTTYYVIATGADNCPAQDSVIVQVGNCCTGPPVISCPADYVGCPGDSTDPANTGTATATYPPGCWPPTITFSDNVMSIGPCAGEKVIKRTWRAEDPDWPAGRFDECIQMITLQAGAPMITSCPAGTTVTCASDILVSQGDINYTTSCGLGATVSIIGPMVAGPDDCPNTTYTYTYKVTDDCNRIATCDRIFTIANSGPTISCPADMTVGCPSEISVDPANATASTSCLLGYNVMISGPVITGPGGCSGGNYAYTYTVTDNCGRTASCVQNFAITNDTAPVPDAPPADVTIDCDDPIPSGVDLSATDDCDGIITVSPTETNIPGNCPNEYTIKRTWTFTDGCGNSSSTFQQIFVEDNDAPVIGSSPSDVYLDCDDPIPGASDLSAMDNCDGTITISPTETNIPGNCPNEYTIKRTWTFTDGCGNSSSTFQQIFVEDNDAPVIGSSPADIYLDCDDPIPSAGNLSAVDNCAGTITVSPTETTIAGSCPQEYTIKRTWTFTDDCGNSSSTFQKIFIEDNEAPVFTSVPADKDVCGSPPPFGTPSTMDNCGSVSLTHMDQTIWDDCINGEKKIRTWTATDDCGNSSTASQMIIFNHDAIAPEFWDCPGDIIVDADPDCTKKVYWTPPIATDNCGTPSITSSHDPGDSFSPGMTVVTYTATDNCGNTAVCTFKVTVNGDAIQIICPDDIYADCDNYYGKYISWNLPTATGGCGNTCSGYPGYISGFVYMGEWNGHYYYCSTFAATWTSAKAYAESAGGYLAVINDAQENQFLANLVQASAAYIGMSDAAFEGNYEWVNGDPVTYTNWYPGQPNNYNGAQDYVELLNNGYWNDQYAKAKREFIMEIPCSNIRQISGPPRGGLFPPGKTKVCYEATDGQGNTDVCCFFVNVNGLSIDCPDDKVVNCYAGYNGAYVSWKAPDLHYCGSSCVGYTYLPNYLYMGEYDGHHYYCSNFPATWAEAKMHAENNGGTLAILNTLGENNYLASQLASTAWIGLTDENVEGQWEWINGDPLSFTNWYPGQPNNYNGAQDYGELINTGHWNDQYAKEKREFIIEMPCTRIRQIVGPPPGSWFDIGTHTIKYVGFDGSGATDTCSFTVTVNCYNDPNYCGAGGNNSYYTWIQRIRLGDIDNNSGNNGGYGNFSNMMQDVYLGQSYPVAFYPGYTSTYTMYWKIWIDWNQDGDFYDQGEAPGGMAGAYTLYGQLTIPYYAKPGKTRVRIGMSYGGYPPGPCSTFNYGEVEDYSIFIHDPYLKENDENEMAMERPVWDAENLDEMMASLAEAAPDREAELIFLYEEAGQPISGPQLPDQTNHKMAIAVFPNPANQVLQVNMSAILHENGRLMLFNSLGQVLYEQRFDEVDAASHSIDLTQLEGGVYFLQWRSDAGTSTSTHSFVIQRD